MFSTNQRFIIFSILNLGVILYVLTINQNAHELNPLTASTPEAQALTLVSKSEAVIFKKLGELDPCSYLFANHLESFSLPYFHLKPLQLSPRHAGSKIRYESGMYRYYPNGDLSLFSSFFARENRVRGARYLYLPYRREHKDFDVVIDNGKEVILSYNRELEKGKDEKKKS